MGGNGATALDAHSARRHYLIGWSSPMRTQHASTWDKIPQLLMLADDAGPLFASSANPMALTACGGSTPETFTLDPNMPYFVFKITEPKKLEYLDTKDKYQDAKALVRQLRAEQAPANPNMIRMVFAKTEAEAKKILSRPRDDRVMGEY